VGKRSGLDDGVRAPPSPRFNVFVDAVEDDVQFEATEPDAALSVGLVQPVGFRAAVEVHLPAILGDQQAFTQTGQSGGVGNASFRTFAVPPRVSVSGCGSWPSERKRRCHKGAPPPIPTRAEPSTDSACLGPSTYIV
jgi:hypothetical protein